jgi:S-adenosylmethionine/arginine decarboxylase-like enzyme
MLDVAGCDVAKATDPSHIAAFSRELVKRIDMVAYGEPQVVHFADHCADKAGWTLVQLIETSNICGHFLDENGDLYLDVFSCKQFNSELVRQTVQEYFSPMSIRSNFTTRDARYQHRENLE